MKHKPLLANNILTPEVRRVPDMMAYVDDLEPSLRRLHEYGYTGVEWITTDPKTLDLSKLDALLETYQLKPVAVNTGRLCGELHLTLSDPDPAVRRACIARTKEVLDFAAHWNVPINVGVLHGNYRSDVPRHKTEQWTIEALQELCAYVGHRPKAILIETVCYFYSGFLNTLEEAEALIRAVGSPAMGVMYDFVQMQIEERDALAAARRWIDTCGHVHLAELSRKAPGSGSMDFGAIVKTLRDAGYEGAYSVELLPRPDQDTAAKDAAQYLIPLLI